LGADALATDFFIVSFLVAEKERRTDVIASAQQANNDVVRLAQTA
jgi:hypothetical protein